MTMHNPYIPGEAIAAAVDTAAEFITGHPPAPTLLPGMQEQFNITPEDELREQVAGIIDWHARNSPRSLQTALGPSEIGHPCSRKIGYHIIDAPKINPGFDVLPSEIGTAYHERMANHLLAENIRLGRERYLVETRVTVWEAGEGGIGNLTGSADCYDTDVQRVIDWKILGNSSMKKTSTNGPIVSYKKQLQMYGKGFEREGYPVKDVALVAIPRAGTTAGIRAYIDPYDPGEADRVHERWINILVLVDILGVERNPEGMYAIEAVGENCEFCPWFTRRPDASGLQCSGPGPKTPAEAAEAGGR